MASLYRTSSGDLTSWIAEYLQPRYPELVEPFLDALEVCRKSHSTGSLCEADARKLLAYATSTRTPLSQNAATFLGELCDAHSTAREAVRELAASSRVHERINALIALDSCQCGEIHKEILATALADRSARIRALAADKIVGHGMKSLLSELAVAIAREKDEKLKVELVSTRELVMHGYHIRQEGDYVYVTCRPPRWSSTFRVFSHAAFEKEGREWIAAHVSPQDNA